MYVAVQLPDQTVLPSTMQSQVNVAKALRQAILYMLYLAGFSPHILVVTFSGRRKSDHSPTQPGLVWPTITYNNLTCVNNEKWHCQWHDFKMINS